MTNDIPTMEAAPPPGRLPAAPERLRRVTVLPDPKLGMGANVGQVLLAGSGFRVVSGVRAADIIIPTSSRAPAENREADNARALTGPANGQWFPVSFESLTVVWSYDQAGTQTVAKRPIVLEIALGHESSVVGVAGVRGAFIEEHLSRGSDVTIDNAAGGYVLFSDSWADESDLLQQSPQQDELGRTYWHKRPHLSHYGTLDWEFSAADPFDVGFFFWDGVAMRLFRSVQSAAQTFAGGTTEVLMAISPCPPGGFAVRAVKRTAGTTDLSWSGCVRGGMRL